MRQLEGFEDESGDVLRLIKTIYGLKQAGHDFHELLKNLLTEAGFKKCPADPGVFVREEGGNVVVLTDTVWVDDIVLAGNSKEMIDLRNESWGRSSRSRNWGSLA